MFRKHRTTICLVLAGLLLTALAAGITACGNKTREATEEDKALLTRAQEVSVGAMSMHIDADTSFSLGQAAGSTQQMVFSGDMQADGNQVTAMHVTFGGEDATGLAGAEMYLTGNRLYMMVPGQGWVWMEADLQQLAGGGQTGFTTPAGVLEMLEGADTVEVTETGKGLTTFHLILSEKYFDTIQEKATETGSAPQLLEQLAQLRSVFTDLSMDLYLTIDNASANLMDVKMSAEFVTSQEAGGDTLTMDMKLSFSDYGKQVDVTLPADAASAVQVTADQLGL
jgi:hypothetical protein